jgi:glycosyltransferase involved in cell wall biosynthesis
MKQIDHQKKVFLIYNSNASRIQGSTEIYYLSQFLAEESNLHVFAPLERSVEGAINHSLPITGITGVLLLNIFLTPYWLYYFLKERPDIVYCYENIILPAILGRWVFGATIAFDLRSDPYDQAIEFFSEDDRGPLFRLFLRIGKYTHSFVLRWAHYVFVLSEPLAETVIANYGIDRSAIRLLPLGVDTKRFTPVEESYDRFSIVYIGTLNKHRDIDTLIEAVGSLSPELQANIRLDLYGKGPNEYISDLISHASEGSPVEVQWHGMIPHEDIPKRAGKSDIAVSPLPAYEAYQVSSPAKIFEYLALGLPVVASRISPHERILTENSNALLYEPESADSLRNQLERIVENKEMRDEFAENARSTALEYSWEQRFSVVEESLNLKQDL